MFGRNLTAVSGGDSRSSDDSFDVLLIWYRDDSIFGSYLGTTQVLNSCSFAFELSCLDLTVFRHFDFNQVVDSLFWSSHTDVVYVVNQDDP